MPGLDIAAASGILRSVYLPKVREQLNAKVKLLQQLETNSDDVVGEEVTLSLHTTRSAGVGNIADGGTLATPGVQGYTKQRVPLRTIAGRIRFTIQVMMAMKTDQASWERAATSETQRLTKDIQRDVNRQLAGDGTGTIATTAANAAVNVIVLSATTTLVQMRQFHINMVVDISTAATPGDAAKASARTITAIDETNKTITLSGAAITTASTDRVERKGNGGAVGGTTQKEFSGLQLIVSDTGTLHNVNPATVPAWKAVVDSNGGVNRTCTENILEKAMDNVDIVGDGNVKLFFASHGVVRNYSNQLTGMKRANDTLELKGGFSGLRVSSAAGDAGMLPERDIPANTAFGLDTDHIRIAEWNKLDWLQDPDVLRQTPDQLAMEGTAFWIAELVTDARNTNAVVKDLTES